MMPHELHQHTQDAAPFLNTPIGQSVLCVIMLGIGALTELEPYLEYLGDAITWAIKIGSGIAVYFTIRNSYHLHKKNQRESK